jgi:hypothetical protein
MTTTPAIQTRIALLNALQEIGKAYLTANNNAERAAFMLALSHVQAALTALE